MRMEVPERVLPPKEETTQVVEEKEVEEIEVPVPKESQPKPEPEGEEPVEDKAPVGAKTPETQLYSKLREEREKRKELERQLQEERANKSSAPIVETAVADNAFPDIDLELKTVKSELAEMRKEKTMDKLMAEHPQLIDKLDEFEEFLEDGENKNIPLQRAAKLFLAENGILNVEKKNQRKGLESPTGGPKTPPSTKMSEDDLKRVRENSPRKYLKLIREGKVDL